MNTIYLNIKQQEESRIIVVRNNKLVDFEQEFQGEENQKGNVYKGVVVNIEPSLEAAFVDFGDRKNGLLPLRELPAGAFGVSEGGLAEGDKILVQIKKDNIGDKGAGLTGLISLAGRFLVLQSHRQQTFGVSSHATPSERREMSEILSTLPVPEDMGAIARSMALNHSREDILWDLQSYLLPLWKQIKTTYETHEDPVLIYCENNLLLRVVRDYFRPDSGDVVICDDEAQYNTLHALVKTLFPENAGQIQYHGGAESMVPAAIEEKIEQIYMREVSVPSGVRIVFDTTEAMVAIDVNSGRQRKGANIEETALKTNLEAAEIIAEQLRLRNLGGLVVIDFIDMQKRENSDTLERRVAELMKKDRARVRMSRISEFGLMELSRQRTSRSLLYSQTKPCPRCSGSGQIWREESFALSLLRKMRTVAFSKGTGSIILQVPRETGVFLLNEKRADIREIEEKSGCNIVVVPDNRFFSPQYKIKMVKADEKESVFGVVNQMAKQEEADEYVYKKPPVHEEKEAVVQNMLPNERMPSRQTAQPPKRKPRKDERGGKSESQSGFFQRLIKVLFSDEEAEPQNEKQEKAATQRRGGRRGSAQGRGGADGDSSSRQRSRRGGRDGTRDSGGEGRQRAAQQGRNGTQDGSQSQQGEAKSSRSRRSPRGERGERGRGEGAAKPEAQSAAPAAADAPRAAAGAPKPAAVTPAVKPAETAADAKADTPKPTPALAKADEKAGAKPEAKSEVKPAVTAPTPPAVPARPAATPEAKAEEKADAKPAPAPAAAKEVPPAPTPPAKPAPQAKVLPPIVRSTDAAPAAKPAAASASPPAKVEATPPPVKPAESAPPAKAEASPPPAKPAESAPATKPAESTPPAVKPAATDWVVPGGDSSGGDKSGDARP